LIVHLDSERWTDGTFAKRRFRRGAAVSTGASDGRGMTLRSEG
jgi:hypothetical protein